ncbi:TldD/PmbA family protein [Caulobacter vibrioides]|uniref:TldD/PmbA family protein n=2 Tax=Caulobacter vibrioides TaxID=155892 RepID=Q9A4K7_CAUVC|nr:TldD/PmbA family protein [Caulobacter vibrioides]YP_002518288.1 TldD/PmbA family protein [Caulobacter vibrioides NA1000]AAK24788.1 TldD/PmbA family protein [Caulobacter vibrioides CB15]ACL96380.1 TldD/PmbA family protein [Caulobacter vibrioides NA1000]ATC25730.1 TldD/PmbA family protein [Caulobacter vibrioides]ATC29657.1 TldD/PmbA family protein [Caulobacter vibrioides]AZH13876.1 TldD/PmbA family protein [Caulobacter vibrioides]
MGIMTEAEAKTILDKVLKLSTADECTAQLTGSIEGNIRFALNNVSTSGVVSDTNLGVSVAFGRRVGTASTNDFSDASLARAVKRAEELARLAPENPEFVPAVEKQVYKPSSTFSAATAAITPEQRAEIAMASIAPCRAKNLIAAGFLNDEQSFVAFANSKGAFGYQRSTDMDYTCTVRTADGRGSGWVARSLQDSTSFKPASDIEIAMRKASASAEAQALEPGKYTVILEPAAASGLISFMFNFFDARQADEGRSFLSKKGGGNKLGEQVYDPRVTFMSDPWHPELAVLPWDATGRAREKMAMVENGKIANLIYTPYWAQKQGKPVVGRPGNIIMSGGTKSTADLVRETERGILVTRTWYIRMVDPQTVLLTGLTRDGTFYIENGQLKYPLKNFRFNESPVIMLNNIDELGRPVRVGEGMPMMIPPMRVRDFTFTSLSDAV